MKDTHIGDKEGRLKTFVCPICGSQIDHEKLAIDSEVLSFLQKLREDDTLNEYLKVSKVYIDIIKQGASTTAIVTKVMSIIKTEMKDITETEIDQLVTELPQKIEDALKNKVTTAIDYQLILEKCLKDNVTNKEQIQEVLQKILAEIIPDTQQIKTLSEVLPQMNLNIGELLRKQEVPKLKGDEGERELHEELTDYFPEDEFQRLGGPGQTDIVAHPKQNGLTTKHEVMIESKKSKWNRSHLDELTRHMRARSCEYGIVAVDIMPQGSNGYLTEYFDKGVIFVCNTRNCKMAYGAIRAILISEYTLRKRAQAQLNLQMALKDINIQNAIKSAFSVSTFHEAIRKHATSIIGSAKKINEEANDADDLLRSTLNELQIKIERAIETSEVTIIEPQNNIEVANETQ